MPLPRDPRVSGGEDYDTMGFPGGSVRSPDAGVSVRNNDGSAGCAFFLNKSAVFSEFYLNSGVPELNYQGTEILIKVWVKPLKASIRFKIMGALFLIIILVTGGKAMGGGDFKLVMAAGLFLGLKKSLLALFIASLFG